MKDNNNALLSREKSFQRLQYLIELQEKIRQNKTIQEAKRQQGESNYSTSLNPIV